MATDFRHLGIAVESLETAIPFWRDMLGLEFHGIEDVPSEGVRVAMLSAGSTKIELLQATTTTSPIATFVEKYGPGIHHMALGVDDVNQSSSTLSEAGLKLIGDVARPGAEGTRVSFVHPKSTGGILLELVDDRGEKDH